MRVPNYLYYILGEIGFHLVYVIVKTNISNKIKLLQRKWRLLPTYIQSSLNFSNHAYSQGISWAELSNDPHSHACFLLTVSSPPHPPTQKTFPPFSPPFILSLPSTILTNLGTAIHSTFSWLFAHTSIYVCFSPPTFPWPQSSQRKQFVFSSSLAIFNPCPTWWFSLFGNGKEYVMRGEWHGKEHSGRKRTQAGNTGEDRQNKGQRSDFNSNS